MRLEDSSEDDDCEAIGDKIAGNNLQGSFTSANASRLQNYSVYVVDIPYFCLFVYYQTHSDQSNGLCGASPEYCRSRSSSICLQSCLGCKLSLSLNLLKAKDAIARWDRR